MASGIYLPNGYLDMGKIIFRAKTTFIWVIGGRATGKTFGALSEILKRNMKMLLVRRTQVQADLIKNPMMNPFKSINTKLGTKITLFKLTKYNSLIGEYYVDGEGKEQLVEGGEKGYTAALSTFSSMRGVDFSDVDIIVYDEFIPEKTVNEIRGEFDALMNLYETVNRNRELEGRPPVRFVGLSNSTDAANPIFMGAHMTDRALKMSDSGKEVYVDQKRDYTLYVLGRTEIGEQKSKTALYRFAGKTYADHSLDNKFVYNAPAKVASRDVREYKPIVTIGELTIYKRKTEDLLYVTTYKTGSPPEFDCLGNDLLVFLQRYYRTLHLYMASDRVEYERYEYEVLLKGYINLTV